MRKYIIILILCLVLLPIKILAIDLYSNNAVLYNLDTDEILLDKNKDEQVSIASMTKIMTALVVLENIENLDDKVIIPAEAFDRLVEENAYQAGFKVGDIVTYRDLLYALMMVSGADAAQTLAIEIGKNIPNFVIMMNKKGKDIGLKNTSFANPIGLDDPNNYSTVNDVAKLLKYALDNKTFYQIFTATSYTTSNKALKFTNSMDSYKQYYNIDTSFIDGAKTGYTYDAGFCLASISFTDKEKLLLVTAKAPYEQKIPYHIYDAVNVYTYYTTNYIYKDVLNKDEVIKTIPVKGLANKKEVKIKVDEALYQYLPKDANIRYEYDGVDYINASYHKGDPLGHYTVYLDNRILYQAELKLDDKIIFYYNYIIGGLVGLVILFITLFIIRRHRHIFHSQNVK